MFPGKLSETAWGKEEKACLFSVCVCVCVVGREAIGKQPVSQMAPCWAWLGEGHLVQSLEINSPHMGSLR
jgi:hypothetical protein